MSSHNDPRAMNGSDQRDTPEAAGAGPLPDALESFEATLASLVPRRDRLDEERLWFEAGRRAGLASCASRNHWAAVASSSAVSAGLAVAATLLIMLSVRPEAGGVQRLQRSEAPLAEAGDPALPEAPDRSRHEPPSREPAPASTPRKMAAFEPRGGRAMQLETLDLLLRQGADPWAKPTAPSAAASTLASELPTHFQQRQDLLGEPADLQPQRGRRNPHTPGV